MKLVYLKVTAFFLLCVLSVSVLARESRPTIVVLLSFNKTRYSSADTLGKKYYKYLQEFYDEEKFDVKVISQAGQYDLWKHINSDKTVALIWLSHAQIGIDGVTKSSIVDIKGNNAVDVFEHIGSNLKFLAVLSCHAKTVLKKINFSEELVTFLPDQKITPTKWFKKAVKKSLEVDLDVNINNFFQEEKFTNSVITIKRTNLGKSDLLPEKIYIGGRLKTILPHLKINEYIKQEINLDIVDYSFYNLKIVAKLLGDKQMVNDKLFDKEKLEFILNSDIRGEWKVFSDKDGTPIGVTQRIFHFKNFNIEKNKHIILDTSVGLISLPLYSN